MRVNGAAVHLASPHVPVQSIFKNYTPSECVDAVRLLVVFAHGQLIAASAETDVVPALRILKRAFKLRSLLESSGHNGFQFVVRVN